MRNKDEPLAAQPKESARYVLCYAVKGSSKEDGRKRV